MARRRFLVSYDIRDPGRLRAVHKTMKEFGQALQYSVFVCDLDGMEKLAMVSELKDRLNHSADSVMMIDLGDPVQRGTECFEFIGPRLPLPRGGPTIV